MAVVRHHRTGMFFLQGKHYGPILREDGGLHRVGLLMLEQAFEYECSGRDGLCRQWLNAALSLGVILECSVEPLVGEQHCHLH